MAKENCLYKGFEMKRLARVNESLRRLAFGFLTVVFLLRTFFQGFLGISPGCRGDWVSLWSWSPSKHAFLLLELWIGVAWQGIGVCERQV